MIMGCGWYHMTEKNMPEDKDLSLGTSVIRSYMEKIDNIANVENYKYFTRGYHAQKNRLKDISYVFSNLIDMPKDMYPQGICFSDEYAFITAYSDDKETLGKVMIYDKSTGELVLTLGMDENSHLGGIAFDGYNVWVCNSSKMALERISYTFISVAIQNNRGKCVDIRNLVETYPVNVIPSCITFYDGLLWVATHAKHTNSQMVSYHFDVINNKLSFDNIFYIPPKVQGITFDENGRVILSTSYGRRNSSYIKIYSSVNAMSVNLEMYDEMIELPPCSEGIAMDDQKIYVIFESAGEKYLEGTDGNGKSIAPLDKILIIDRTST